MTTTNCPRCNHTFPLDGICLQGHVHRVEIGIFCICSACGFLMTLNDDRITFREVNADELEKIPVAALIWAARLQAHIQARRIVNRARAAAANN
jgi:hypothetical protein